MTGKGKARTGAKTSQIYEEAQETAFTVGNDVFPESIGMRRGRCSRCEVRKKSVATEGQRDTAQSSVSRPIGVRNMGGGKC